MSAPPEGDGLTSSALRRLLSDARVTQRLPKSSVSADSIFEAYQLRRGDRRARISRIVVGVGACLSLAYLGVSAERAVESGRPGVLVAASLDVAQGAMRTASTKSARPEHDLRLAGATRIEAIDPSEVIAPSGASDPSGASAPSGASDPSDPSDPIDPSDPSDRIRPVATELDAASPKVLGPRAIALSDGAYRISLEAGDSALSVETAGGTIDLRAGVAIVTVAGDKLDVSVERGEAYWVRGDERAPIHAVAEEPAEGAAKSGPVAAPLSAAELAERAEESLHRGRRSVAIRHLRQLVAKHPRSTEAGPGLLDLGRLLRAEGDVDSARCAYQLYLDRYPSGALVTEVKRARERLGDGPRCRGLRPRG